METELKGLEVRLHRVAEMIGTPLREKRVLSRVERDLVLENLRGIYDDVSLLSTNVAPSVASEVARDGAMTADEVHSAAMMVTMAAMSRPEVEAAVEEVDGVDDVKKTETSVVADVPHTLFDVDVETAPVLEEAVGEPEEPQAVAEDEATMVEPVAIDSTPEEEPIAAAGAMTTDAAVEIDAPKNEVEPEVDDNQLLFEDIEFDVDTAPSLEPNAPDVQPWHEEESPVETASEAVETAEQDVVDDGIAEEIILNVEPESAEVEPILPTGVAVEGVAEPVDVVDAKENEPAVQADAPEYNSVELDVESEQTQAEHEEVVAEEPPAATFHLPVEPPAALADMPIGEVGSTERQPQGTILDYLRRPSGNPAITRTLGETIGQSQQQPSFTMPKVDDLRTVININDKFSFMSELFGGNIKSYNDFIVRLNAMTSREEALVEVERVSRQYHWNADSSVVKTFQKIFDKKF
ncbi:MAG: hypothetical protein IJ761_01560 [Bacteroidales bacterium]|nr:hypothetical protein [Bacteroidales bacterium]